MNYYDIKPYRDHKEDPAISVYILSDSTKTMEKVREVIGISL